MSTTKYPLNILPSWPQWRRGKEGNVLFNDALNTFNLRLYGVRYMVKDHSDKSDFFYISLGVNFIYFIF